MSHQTEFFYSLKDKQFLRLPIQYIVKMKCSEFEHRLAYDNFFQNKRMIAGRVKTNTNNM